MKGAYWNCGKWKASIRANGKDHYLGRLHAPVCREVRKETMNETKKDKPAPHHYVRNLVDWGVEGGQGDKTGTCPPGTVMSRLHRGPGRPSRRGVDRNLSCGPCTNMSGSPLTQGRGSKHGRAAREKHFRRRPSRRGVDRNEKMLLIPNGAEGRPSRRWLPELLRSI
jgi:hypothetical protein